MLPQSIEIVKLLWYAGSCAIVFRITFHVMRSLIPHLHPGPRGSMFSVPPRILAPFLVPKCHLPASSTQLGAFRSYSATSVCSQVRLPSSICTPQSSCGFSALNRVPGRAWVKCQQPLSTSQILGSIRSAGTNGSLSQRGETLPAEVEVEGFGRSEKASRAAQVNLSARLNKDGSSNSTKSGMGEIIRLLRIARPEAKWLGGMGTKD